MSTHLSISDIYAAGFRFNYLQAVLKKMHKPVHYGTAKVHLQVQRNSSISIRM